MELKVWIASFREMHEKAKKRVLVGDELAKYLALRDELAKAMVVAQGLTLKEGETPRKLMRIARGLQIDLDLTQGRVRFMTQNLSAGGFACLMPKDPGRAEGIGFSLRLPGSPDPLIGRARVVDVQARPGNVMTSFTFEGLAPDQLERLELMIFDTVLQQMSGAKL